ncbi:hypothetical protein Dsin_028281 [Dipteronia sinensis]|uniref:Reverse transcriptase n=1 Tax=Dipteronia sinensis TaxID=43782 RepID=A0AAD9ZQX5_9ROSI|nr:hypothetical protein Dsin_028281 [Dipteronia sinensis]
MDVVLVGIEPRLSESMGRFLDGRFTADEIKSAIFDMGATNVLGPNGLPALFYQRFWDIVGPSVTLACHMCLNEGANLHAMNGTVITLIPKVSSADRMTDFRRISLCNVLYKIIAKALAYRFRLALGEVITETQSAFIPGHSITDNAIVGFECLHNLKRKKRKDRSLGKLNMSKAYDIVELGFIEQMMLRMGFSASWVDRILRCADLEGFYRVIHIPIPSPDMCGRSRISFYLKLPIASINRLCNYAIWYGVKKYHVTSKSGEIRVRDPREYRGRIQGISVDQVRDPWVIFRGDLGDIGGFLVKILHDASAIIGSNSLTIGIKAIWFGDGDVKSLREIFSPLAMEEDMLLLVVHNCAQGIGQKVMQGVWWKKMSMADELPDRRRTKETDSGRNRGVDRDADKRMDRGTRERSIPVWDKIKGWKGRLLSAGGKKVLIKAVIQSISTYAMSLFRLPLDLIQEINRLCTRSLLVKQCWRIMKRPTTLAARVLKSCCFPRSCFLEADCSESNSFMWKSLHWGKGLLERGLRWRVGDGKAILIYKNQWFLRPTTLKIFSPQKLGEFATAGQLLSPTGGWDVEIIKNNFNVDDADAFLSLLVGNGSSQDMLLWHYEQSGIYSLKSGYRLGCNMRTLASTSGLGEGVSWWKFSWKADIPTKVKVFIWKACNNWIPTRVNLAMKGFQVASGCPICLCGRESTLHALWGCSKLRGVRECWKLDQGNFKGDQVQFFDFMLYCFDKWDEESVIVFCVGLWRLWNGCGFELPTYHRLIATYAPHVAEMVALYRGLLLAYEIGCFEVETESDAALVINWVSDGKAVDSDVGLILEDILSLSRRMRFCNCKFIPSECN